MQQTQTLGTSLGRALRYQEVTARAVSDRFAEMGFPDGFADAYIAMLASTVEHPAEVTNDVDKILDRPATPFADWAAAHRAAFTSGR